MPATVPGQRRPAALVTGASGGIGAAIARDLLADGYDVVNLSNVPPTQDTGLSTHLVDLTDPAATRAALEATLARQAIDVFVHCAGIPHMNPIEAFDLEAFQAVAAIHLQAALQCAAALVPGMQARRRGRILFIGSRVGLGRTHSAIYSAAKAGLTGITRSLAVELAPFGITVNCVSPGPVDTPMLRTYHPPGSAARQRLEASIPMGRVADIADVAHAAAFFLAPAAGYVTGQNLFVCGGIDIAPAAPR